MSSSASSYDICAPEDVRAFVVVVPVGAEDGVRVGAAGGGGAAGAADPVAWGSGGRALEIGVAVAGAPWDAGRGGWLCFTARPYGGATAEVVVPAGTRIEPQYDGPDQTTFRAESVVLVAPPPPPAPLVHAPWRPGRVFELAGGGDGGGAAGSEWLEGPGDRGADGDMDIEWLEDHDYGDSGSAHPWCGW